MVFDEESASIVVASLSNEPTRALGLRQKHESAETWGWGTSKETHKEEDRNTNDSSGEALAQQRDAPRPVARHVF